MLRNLCSWLALLAHACFVADTSLQLGTFTVVASLHLLDQSLPCVSLLEPGNWAHCAWHFAAVWATHLD
jgi:hypothetical protein